MSEKKVTWKNPWVFGAIGLVLVTVAVNVGLIWLTSQKGISFVDQEYNAKNRKSDTETLEYIQQQRAIGWQVSLKQPAEIHQNQPTAYQISVADKQGAPVAGVMRVMTYRAADASQDFWTDFKQTAPGEYDGEIVFPLKGFWELRVEVTRDNETFTTATDKLEVKAN